MISYSVIGASGYVGGEILRLAHQHPQLSLDLASANSNAGEPIRSIHPHLFHLRNSSFDDIDLSRAVKSDVVFLALPHGKSAEIAAGLSPTQLVIDAGADFRISNETDWRDFYDTPDAGVWPYGLPEMTLAPGGKQREKLLNVKRIAAPGCNVSAVTLATAPGYAAAVLGANLSATLAVGTSGAGRTLRPNLLASEVYGGASAYGVAGAHRHNPEIRQNLLQAGAKNLKLTFTPILVPMSRGILAVCHADLAPDVSERDLRSIYEDAYAGEPFIQVLPQGLQPTTKAVTGSNYVQIGIEVDNRTRMVTVSAALDNLVKGTAGAAIQSMNIALGLDESLGLEAVGVAP